MGAKTLLITGKWPLNNLEIDGGGMSGINIVESLLGKSEITLLLPESYCGLKIKGISCIKYYHEDNTNNEDYENRFICRMKTSKNVSLAINRIASDFDKIIIIHVFHAFSICADNNLELCKKITLFPMFLSPSYRKCGDNIPNEYEKLERATLHKVGKIITPSEFEKLQLINIYKINPQKIVVLPRFVSSVFSFNNHKVDAKNPYICYVASIKRQKQNIKAIQLLSYLRAKGYAFHLCLIGSVVDEKLFAEMNNYIINEQLKNSITIMPYISQTDLSVLYSKAFVNISVSRCETFGRSIIEGLYSGLPAVVLEDVDCFNMLVGCNNGVLFSSSIENMGEQIIKMYHDPIWYNELCCDAQGFGIQFSEERIRPMLTKELL